MEQSSAYINLLKKMLTDYHRVGTKEYIPVRLTHGVVSRKLRWLDRLLRPMNYTISQVNKSSEEERLNGKDRPMYADTMVGMKRLDNIEFCVRDVIENNVEGDLIELGVWRGGSTILMRAILKEINITNRFVWVADSFEGLPTPDPNKYPADRGDKHFQFEELKVSLDEVKHNFEKYGLLDEQVKFLKGWFKDTLPKAPINKLAILRLDGDMYESTMDGLTNLYPKLSKGGYIIIDDWGAVPACMKAVEDYRKHHGITEEIKTIDWTGVYWKKENA